MNDDAQKPLNDSSFIQPIQIPPLSRTRLQADGVADDTFRLVFDRLLTPQLMRVITFRLVEMPMQPGSHGILALTKVEYLEPDTCDVRYHCQQTSFNDRLPFYYDLWTQLQALAPILQIDGVHYTWLNGGT